jgi:5,5'-dehydrodivanillate O-demethylase oxygenase subunit
MLTKDENERVTRVGRGMPAGEMLRRYWWPVGFSDSTSPTSGPARVRLLGEDLVLFRDGEGALGLLGLHCSHRGTSLEFGRVESDGIRCPYHGWLYAPSGRCLDQPAEPEDSTYKSQIRHLSYSVQELGGLIFAYLGPEPAPLLPRYDLLCAEGGERLVGADEEYCNWMQRAENGMDEHHLSILHASVYPDTAMKRLSVSWDRTWYGSRTTVDLPGLYPEPRVTHFVFPSHSRITLARIGTEPSHNLRLRVPTDDTKTTTFWVNLFPGKPPGRKTEGFTTHQPGVYPRVEDGWWGLPSHEQDRAAQESQGMIADRAAEHLASSDRGVLIFRQMLLESIDAVARGEDPVGVVRDPAANEFIAFDARMPQVAALR